MLGGWSVVCDHVLARVFPQRCILVLADGCGFGERARKVGPLLFVASAVLKSVPGGGCGLEGLLGFCQLLSVPLRRFGGVVQG